MPKISVVLLSCTSCPLFGVQIKCGDGGILPRLSTRRRSPRPGHRLAARPAGLATLRRSNPRKPCFLQYFAKALGRSRSFCECGDGGIRTHEPLLRVNTLAPCPVRPLWHVSENLFSFLTSLLYHISKIFP